MDRIMSKQKVFSGILGFFLGFVPFLGAAQTPSGNEAIPPSEVAVMSFVGDDLSIGSDFQQNVIGEVQGLGGYTTERVTAERVPESLSFPPDQPPEPVYLGDSRLVLTGEYYIDMDDLQHFQLWLWNSASGALVYTDEMVFEDMVEAEGYLPPMVSWIFSHVPVEQQVTVVENTPQVRGTTDEQREESAAVESREGNGLYLGRFYLGLRGGGSFNAYSSLVAGGYEAGTSQGFSAGGAVVLEYRIFRFLGLQAEAIFNYDTFKVAKIATINANLDKRVTDRYSSMSLMFPLLVKVPLEIGNFSLAPFVGLYYAMPIGTLKLEPGDASVGPAAGSYAYAIDPPLGLLLGIDSGLLLGPGELFVDLRFSRDIGMTVADKGYGIQYVRNQIGLSLGYKFQLFGPRR
ncbi:hypothetical protein LQZ21_08845 [Treponema sp. TIM-1]|uniref:hypothetical protein n=1 Tax=Treponema sp. TIM-1 TaxID=2898417 RepID=UPI00397ED0C7